MAFLMTSWSCSNRKQPEYQHYLAKVANLASVQIDSQGYCYLFVTQFLRKASQGNEGINTVIDILMRTFFFHFHVCRRAPVKRLRSDS